jgi:hypothetical protein
MDPLLTSRQTQWLLVTVVGASVVSSSVLKPDADSRRAVAALFALAFLKPTQLSVSAGSHEFESRAPALRLPMLAAAGPASARKDLH